MKEQSQAAFSLVEVTLALGVAAFCLIAVFGLVPVGVQTNRNATSQTFATNILSGVVSDIRASPKGSSTTTAKYKIRRGKGASTTVCFDSQGQPDPLGGQIGNVNCRAGNWRYRLYVKIYPITALTDPNLIPYRANYVVLKLVWPAAADPVTITPSGSVEMVTSFFDN